jgi:hypothetical protein
MITNSMYLTLWPARLDAGRPERSPFAEKLCDQSPRATSLLLEV